MRGTVKILFIPIFIVVIASPSFAAVTLRIQNITKNVRTDYTGEAQVEVVETIKIRHKGDATDYFLTFSKGLWGDFSGRILTDTGSGEELPYQLYDGATGLNVLKDFPDVVDGTSIISGSFGQSNQWQSVDITYIFRIEAGEFARSGTYEDTITVTLYEGDLAANSPADNNNVNFKVDVGAIIQVSLVNTGQSFDPFQTDYVMDFGFFEEGESMSGDLMVRANTLFSIAIESANGGTMANFDPLDTSLVPYDFIFQGSSVDLSAGLPVDLLLGEGPTTYDGLRYGYDVSILPFGWATEGAYEDTLTVTISPN